MQKQIHLVLDANEVGLILDGLEIREEAWRRTATFLETGEAPDGEFFVAEECSGTAEAENIANDYRAIIEKIRAQWGAQKAVERIDDRLPRPAEGTARGFAIYVDTIAEGRVPIEFDETNLPVVYATEAGAQREIADIAIGRLQEFLAGERDFDDAITIEEYMAAVWLFPDGSVALGIKE